MVLGAYHGVEGIPKAWQEGLNAWGKCDKLLTQVLSQSGAKSEL